MLKSIAAEKLPWSAHLAEVASQDYLIMENVRFGIFFKGEECVLSGLLVTVKGSAGGLIDNAAETVTFDSSSFSATGTSLTALGSSAQWSGVFTMLATGTHIGDPLAAS